MSEILEEMGAFFNKRSAYYNEKHLEHVGGIETKHVMASYLPDNTKTLSLYCSAFSCFIIGCYFITPVIGDRCACGSGAVAC